MDGIFFLIQPSTFTFGLSGTLRSANSFLGGAAGLRGTFPAHPRPPSPLVSPFLDDTQYDHSTTSMGGPSGRDSNPADLAVVVEKVFLFLPPPYRQPLKDTHPWPGGGSFLGKNPPPSVRFKPTSAGTATSEHCLRQSCGHRIPHLWMFSFISKKFLIKIFALGI
jgi:hypothetical protein